MRIPPAAVAAVLPLNFSLAPQVLNGAWGKADVTIHPPFLLQKFFFEPGIIGQWNDGAWGGYDYGCFRFRKWRKSNHG